MKRVLILLQTDIISGAETVLKDYFDLNQDHEIFLYTNSNGKIEGFYENIKNVHVYSSKFMNALHLKTKPIHALYCMIMNLWNVRKIIKNERIDVLYGNNTLDFITAALYKKLFCSEMKMIAHIHDIITKNMYLCFLYLFEKQVEIFVVPSIATKVSIEKYVEQSTKIHVVYNGMKVETIGVKNIDCEISKKYCIPNGKIILCFIGQISERKRADLFIEIIKSLNLSKNKYIGIIVGKVVENDFYHEISSKIAADHNIFYLGELPRVEILNEIYPFIDALVCTSDRDPLPTVILECMSMGKTVISREVDGVSEIIDDGIDGFLLPYKFSVEEWVKKIEFIFQNRLDKKISCAAMEKINNKFEVNKKTKIINRLIEEL